MMLRKMSYLGVVLALAACNQFNTAERRLDNPKGKVSDSPGVEASVKGGFFQDSSINIIDSTSATLELPFSRTRVEPFPLLDDLFARPEISSRKELHLAQTLTRLAMEAGAMPYAFSASAEGTIDVAAVTGGECSGTIDFAVSTDLQDLGLAGEVEVTMGYNAVNCVNGGSVDGDIAFRAEFEVPTGFVKIIELVNATVSDGVETATIDFALRVEIVGFGASASLDMGVAVDDESYTLSIDGDLFTGNATVEVLGSDGSLSCDVAAGVATCEGNLTFEL
jgi:hypothetical protein